MKTVLLAAGAAAMALSAGQALGASHHKHKGDSAAIAGPKEPIPYAQLDAYLKASPSQRAKNDWWSGQPALAANAATGAAGANASATSRGPSPTPAPSPSPSDTSSSSSVNPSPTPEATNPGAPPPTNSNAPNDTGSSPSSSTTPPK